jgi:hypothetical protein
MLLIATGCGTWTTGAYGQSCDAVCAGIGMVCNPVCQSNTNTVALVDAALAVAGGWKTVGGPATCSTWYDDGTSAYYGALDPGYDSTDGSCYYAIGGGSTCAAADSDYARLCACSDLTPTTLPSGMWNRIAVLSLLTANP